MSMAAIKEPFLRTSQRGATSKLTTALTEIYTRTRARVCIEADHLSLFLATKGPDREAPIEPQHPKGQM